MSTFANFLGINASIENSTKEQRRVAAGTKILWYPYGGIESPRYPGTLHVLHQLCHITDLSNFTITFQNEETVQEIGKREITVFSGVELEGTLTFKGDALGGLAALIGQHMHNLSTTGVDMQSAIQMGVDSGVKGALIILSGLENQQRNLVTSTYIPDVSIENLDIAGAQVGETNYTVTLKSSKNAFKSGKGAIFMPFMFFDNGTITNAAAPDNALTTFNLKDQNGYRLSGSDQTAPLLAQTINPAITTPDKYVQGLRVNGLTVDPAGFSFDQATGVITMNAAPADGAKLEGVVLLPTGFADYDATRSYGPGSVVKYQNAFYTKINTVASLPTVTDNWTALTGQLFEVPYYTGADSTGFHQSSTPEFCLFPWSDFQDLGN